MGALKWRNFRFLGDQTCGLGEMAKKFWDGNIWVWLTDFIFLQNFFIGIQI